MKKILVAYATKSGSTAEVANTIAEDIRKSGELVDVKPLSEVKDISTYDALVVGGPMMMGWHPQVTEFMKKNAQVLKGKPLACFLSAMSLTQTGQNNSLPFPVFKDPLLVKTVENPKELGFKEKFTLVSNYVKPFLMGILMEAPKKVAIFGGKLDLARLNLFERLFVQIIISAKPGDFRNWEAIHAWSAELIPALIN